MSTNKPHKTGIKILPSLVNSGVFCTAGGGIPAGGFAAYQADLGTKPPPELSKKLRFLPRRSNPFIPWRKKKES